MDGFLKEVVEMCFSSNGTLARKSQLHGNACQLANGALDGI